jgi:cysteine desulfurase
MSGTDRPVYLDFNASTPVAPEVAEAMRMVLREPYGNPSSGHWVTREEIEAVAESLCREAGLP